MLTINIDEGAMLLTVHPASRLSSVVECIWHYEDAAVGHGRESVLPDGRFQIVLNLVAGKGTVCGLRSQHPGSGGGESRHWMEPSLVQSRLQRAGRNDAEALLPAHAFSQGRASDRFKPAGGLG